MACGSTHRERTVNVSVHMQTQQAIQQSKYVVSLNSRFQSLRCSSFELCHCSSMQSELRMGMIDLPMLAPSDCIEHIQHKTAQAKGHKHKTCATHSNIPDEGCLVP